eukprot:3379689-Karenia_brevis.AAC.1
MCKLMLVHILVWDRPQTELPTMFIEVWSHAFVGSISIARRPRAATYWTMDSGSSCRCGSRCRYSLGAENVLGAAEVVSWS